MNIKLLREIIREEIERLNREKPIKEVLVREMHYDPKDSKRRISETEPVYYHFSTLEDALEFLEEIKEKYENCPLKLLVERPLPGVLRIGAVEYMIIVRRFREGSSGGILPAIARVGDGYE